MYISEITSEAPENPQSDLERRTYEALNERNIPFVRVDNDSVETMEECLEIGETLGEEIRKTIVVCDRKKTEYHLVVLPAAKRFDGKKFSERLGCKRVSFAKAEDMKELLSVVPGSATVMGILSDTDAKVKVVIDEEVANSEWFACNPGVNTSHIRIKTSDLIDTLLPSVNHNAQIVNL